MTQLTNKFDINDELEENLKELPNSFYDDEGEIPLYKTIIISTILHPIVFGLLTAMIIFIGYHLSMLKKPELKPRDIEFVLTQKEAPPINKNTKYRSDKNSRAGGIHDPKRKVSLPSAPSKASKKSTPAPQVQQKPKTQPKPKPKATPAPAKTPIKQVPKAPAKPAPIKAPSLKPTVKPTVTPPKTQAPKLSSAPKSPFSVAVPKTTAPVGPAPTIGSGSSSKTASGSTSGATKGSGMPAPQFSASKGGTSSGYSPSSGSNASRGSSYSGGNIGNPGPGNPAGAPGIDAIRQPNWGPYMTDLKTRIKRNWNPPKADASKRVVLLFKIGRDGRLLSIQVIKSSGSALADQAAKSAVELSAPFRPLPPEYRQSSVDIDFTFDYNVMGGYVK